MHGYDNAPGAAWMHEYMVRASHTFQLPPGTIQGSKDSLARDLRDSRHGRYSKMELTTSSMLR